MVVQEEGLGGADVVAEEEEEVVSSVSLLL